MAPFQAGNICNISFELRFEPLFCRFDGTKHCVEVLLQHFDGIKCWVEVLLLCFEGSKSNNEPFLLRFNGSKYCVELFESGGQIWKSGRGDLKAG